jgi:hypothetical protein
MINDYVVQWSMANHDNVTRTEERREFPTRRSLVQGTIQKAPWHSYGVCAGNLV